MTRRFAPLFWTQFFSAFSDNFLKTSLVFVILFHIGGYDADALITLATAVFVAPYFFLSALGGELADRYDKAVVARRLKFCEIGIALIAVVGFGLHSAVLLFIALFLFGVIAALFGPIKYGILPDHLARSELPAGNALVQGATFIAILLGTIVGGIAAKDGGDPAHFAFLMIVFSLLCWGASLFIPRTGQGAPDLQVQKNVLVSTIGLLNFLREDPRLWCRRSARRRFHGWMAMSPFSRACAAFILRSISQGSPSPAACSLCPRMLRCRPGPAPTAARAW